MATATNLLPTQKRVKITSKRQFTIPQKFFIDLGFDKDAICTMGDGFLVIQPAKNEDSGEFAEQILTELIVEGFSGQELLDEFKKRQAKIRPGIESLLKEAKEIAQGTGEYYTYDDVFKSKE
jgi:bifunctional DNA-binding transcriptional regulator/antitoxin component of YhaV-PrlF toxin-antitoxin module